MEINRGFKFVKLKIKCRYIHYKRQGFAALSFNFHLNTSLFSFYRLHCLLATGTVQFLDFFKSDSVITFFSFFYRSKIKTRRNAVRKSIAAAIPPIFQWSFMFTFSTVNNANHFISISFIILISLA